jgi:hypothetical protein
MSGIEVSLILRRVELVEARLEGPAARRMLA